VSSANGVQPWSRPAPPPARSRSGGLRRSSASILRRLDRLPPESATDPRASRRRQVLLVTFRRSGRRVATPVWAATDGELLYVRTPRRSGKVKRLRSDNFTLVAPCTPRGRPTHAPVAGRARLLPAAEEAAAEELLRQRGGWPRAVGTALRGLLLRTDHCYLALTVDPPPRTESAEH
jgi:PPOX class probable F420-dependent enzyme